MSDVRETAVKLFGWTITSVFEPVFHDQLSSSSHVLPDSLDDNKDNSSSSSSSSSLQPHMLNNQSATDNNEHDNTSLQISSDLNKESKETTENSDEQESEITTEEKTTELKKPDKILPCPRCNSEDTKFCYYNNYNVNQPRHFCRNCQRYWTAGGSMRTVPVGSGRRKNKGWVSSDHYIHITSENNSNSSSTKILSFESSESLVSENGHHQSSDARIKSDSVSEESNVFHRYLLPQVTSPVSPSWIYQYPLNPSFYHMPVYWGCTVPFLSTFETSKYLGKRTRDEASDGTVRESKDAFIRARLVSESQSTNNEASIATKTDKLSFSIDGSETNSSNRFVPETSLNLQANPAAMARSINFRESM